MVLGWRRAFCSSIRRDRESSFAVEKEENRNSNSSPRICSKFGFFSNPSTPRLQSYSVSGTGLRCGNTETEEAIVPANSVPESPKQLRCKTRDIPKLFNRSNPSSPRSPSTFSLLKSTLRLSKSRCGICLQTVKAGQGMAIFTAECSHGFHFPCIVAHMKKQRNLLCPVCSFQWNEMPLLSINHNEKPIFTEKQSKLETKTHVKSKKERNQHSLKVYDDDEPLLSPTSRVRFNSIPESDEENENGIEFQGYFVNTTSSISESRNIEVTLLPEVVIVSVRRSCQAEVVVLKVRAPPAETKSTHRASIDVVAVVDVTGNMTPEKLQIMKRTMKLIISHLSSADRLSIVAFSSSSKRLLPLRKMTANGRRSVRRMVDAMVVLDGKSSANDAIKKAAKVIEDRRDGNSVASIILLSDVNEKPSIINQRRKNPFVTSTRHPDLDIPVHSIHFTELGAYRHAQNDDGDAFGKCLRSLLSIVVQDLKFELGLNSGSAPGEIAAVYSDTGPAEPLESGSMRIGDLYGGEEREFLVELKIPSSSIGAHHVLSFTCNYADPSTQQSICCKEQALAVPQPHAVRSTAPAIQRLRNLFIATRAVAESRRLTKRNDLNGAHHMLSSARALLFQSSSSSANEFIRGLEAELIEVNRKRDNLIQQNKRQMAERFAFLDEKGEPLTPTSAWRAAECLAKVAIMRKSLNRVSDLHGFEDARF